jgi:two-component system response regulator AlgR
MAGSGSGAIGGFYTLILDGVSAHPHANMVQTGGRMNPMRILVVDDEVPARDRLRRLLSDTDGVYRVAGEASDGSRALELCRSQQIDVVLMDVQTSGVDGLEVARELAVLEPPPAVILVTARKDCALEAYEHRVADYLVKPVRRERLMEALERVQTPTRPQCAALAEQSSGDGRRRQISAHYRGGVRSVRVEDILYLRAEHKYVTVRHTGGDLLVDESLRTLEQEFPDLFLRVHRNALVARDRIAGLERRPDGAVVLFLHDCEETLAVSRRHLPEVRRGLRDGD